MYKLLFVRPIGSEKRVIRKYSVNGFQDFELHPAGSTCQLLGLPALHRSQGYGFVPRVVAASDRLRPWDQSPLLLEGDLIELSSGKSVLSRLVPMGCDEALLRRMTFKITQ